MEVKENTTNTERKTKHSRTKWSQLAPRLCVSFFDSLSVSPSSPCTFLSITLSLSFPFQLLISPQLWVYDGLWLCRWSWISITDKQTRLSFGANHSAEKGISWCLRIATSDLEAGWGWRHWVKMRSDRKTERGRRKPKGAVRPSCWLIAVLFQNWVFSTIVCSRIKDRLKILSHFNMLFQHAYKNPMVLSEQKRNGNCLPNSLHQSYHKIRGPQIFLFQHTDMPQRKL